MIFIKRTFIQKLVSLALVLAFLVCVTQAATADVIVKNSYGMRSDNEGIAKWRSTPYNVTFYNCMWMTLEDDYETALNNAMSTWNAVRDTDGSRLITLSSSTDTDTPDTYTVLGGGLPTGTVAQVIYNYNCSYYNDTWVELTLNSNYNWTHGLANGHYDVQTVLLHELGHCLGIRHCHEKGNTCLFSGDDVFVMYPYAYTFYTKRSLSSNDISRYRSLY